MNTNNRNVLTWGIENQVLLEQKRVAVLGSGNLSQIISASLAGLGVGTKKQGGAIIQIGDGVFSDKQKDLLAIESRSRIGQRKIKTFNSVISKINSDTNYLTFPSSFSAALLLSLGADYLIDATNSPRSKQTSAEFCQKYNIPMLSVSSSRYRAAVTTLNPNDKNAVSSNLRSLTHQSFKGLTQHLPTSCIASGLALEELRKSCFRYEGADDSLDNLTSFHYNSLSFYKNRLRSDLNPHSTDLSQYKVLVIGAGALGNFVALGLADLGINHDIIDFDTIEGHNLNRQLLLYGGEDRYKAEVLAQRLKRYNPNIKIGVEIAKLGKVSKTLKGDQIWLDKLVDEEAKRIGFPNPEFNSKAELKEAILKKYELNEKKEGKGIKLFTRSDIFEYGYDLVLCCVDNKFARIWLEQMCQSKYSKEQPGIPLIDGGTSHDSGQVAVYVPGRYNRIRDPLSLLQQSARYESCIDNPAGSVVMSNSIIGGMMVTEAVKVLTATYEPRNQMLINYDTKNPRRINQIGRI